MRALIKATAIAVFCLPALSAQAITPEKENDIKTLMVLLGNPSMAEEMANGMVTMVIEQEKKKNPNLPKNAEYALSKAIYDVTLQHAPELDELFVSIYDKYYTHQDIKNLIVFFRTPTGTKYSAALVPMMHDMTPVIRTWGESLMPILVKRAETELAKYGYK